MIHETPKTCAQCGKDIVLNGDELCEECAYDIWLDEQNRLELERIYQEELDRIRWESEGGPID